MAQDMVGGQDFLYRWDATLWESEEVSLRGGASCIMEEVGEPSEAKGGRWKGGNARVALGTLEVPAQ